MKVKWSGKKVFIRNSKEKEVEERKKKEIGDMKDKNESNENIKKDEEEKEIERYEGEGKEKWIVMIGVWKNIGCVKIGE